jgi:hypothetical protein
MPALLSARTRLLLALAAVVLVAAFPGTAARRVLADLD